MRTVTYQDDKAVELVLQFKELSKEVAAQTDQITKLEEERSKTAIKGQKIKDKLNGMIKKITKGDEGEFEVVSKVEVNSKRELEISYADMLEEWKTEYRKRKATSETK